MDTQRIENALKKQVSALYKQRHPSKGVVVEVPGFEDAVKRRTDLMNALREHRGNLPNIIRRADVRARTTRRWGHIRKALSEGATLMSISLKMENEFIMGVTFFDGVDAITIPVGDREAILAEANRLKRLANEEPGYIVVHDLLNINKTLEPFNIRFDFERVSIDLSYTTMIFRGQKANSVETGAIVGIDRASYTDDHSQYLVSVARAYAALPDINDLRNLG